MNEYPAPVTDGRGGNLKKGNMGLFHQHLWHEKERFYAPPRRGIELDYVSERLMKKVMFGVTTIHFVCDCGADKFVEILGEQQLHDPKEWQPET